MSGSPRVRVAADPRVGRRSRGSSPVVGDVLAAVEQICPLDQAAEWDNVGLLAGKAEWPASRVMLAIDLTDAVAREALEKRVNLLVVYHPPIFKGIRSVTAESEAPTAYLPDLLASKISIIALHTALDAAVGGTNDVLLDAFDVVSRRPLETAIVEGQRYKLVLFAPHEEVERLRAALSAAGAGVIGHYSECSFELCGQGSFRGDETTNPSVGRSQVLEYVDETRLEMIVPKRSVSDVVRALYANHSYEEPAFDLYPLHSIAGRGTVGMGRVAALKKPARGTDLLKRLRGMVDLSAATVVGDLRRRFRSVTAAAGSFGVRFFDDPASLVLTGEMKHHDALELVRRGMTAVCLGHYASERPVLDVVAAKLRERMAGVHVSISRADRSPFSVIP